MPLVQDSLAGAGFEDAWLRMGFWVLFLVVTKDTVPEGSLYASLRAEMSDRVNDTLMNRFQNMTTLHFNMKNPSEGALYPAVNSFGLCKSFIS